jgi:murein DD-endopeptidase MepM/ murein hydrolase activator NlpD
VVTGRLLAVLAAALVAVLAGAVPATPATAPRASSTAIAFIVRVPGQDTVSVAAASAPPSSSVAQAGIGWPDDGSAVTAASVLMGTRTGPGSTPRSSATASLRQVQLFGGEISVGLVELSAEAAASRRGADGGLGGSRLEGLVVLGETVAAGANQRIGLGDWGYAVILEQAVVEESGDAHAFRGFVTGIHVTLTAEHGGLPAGTELLVGYAEAAAQAPAPPPAPEQPEPEAPEEPDRPDEPGQPPPDEPSIPREPEPEPPGATPAGPPAIVRDPPADVRPQITGQGYVFPVWGPASFSDDFGAPRATTAWHHGNDIFAPLGAPVLAVSDGTLFLVGWNDVGGHRLWLRDRQGNEYYYAHLSAYSPLAVNGAQVEAGDVLGFVGDSGDAAGTPYHLHFEIHPTALLGLGYDGVVNPYEYLLAWNARRDASPVGDGAPLPVPLPAAVIVGGQDIASASGLDPGAIEQAYGAPLFLDATAGFALPAPAPELVGAPPGFAR